MLVGSDDGRVDGRVFVVGIIGQGLEKILPNAAHRPTGEALMRVAPTAKMFWQITPWRADAEFPDYRVNEKTIAKIAVASDRAGTTRKQFFNPGELIVAQSMAFQRKPPSGRLPMNHAFADL